jgi:hypothetical protein
MPFSIGRAENMAHSRNAKFSQHRWCLRPLTPVVERKALYLGLAFFGGAFFIENNH